MSKHVADPSPRSPSDVMADRLYQQVANDLSWGPHGGYMVHLVMFHRGTETYWEANYESASVDQPTNWTQVVPRRVQRLEYQRLP